MVRTPCVDHHRGMVRSVLLAWVLLSIPLSVALGRMYRHAAEPRPGGWDPSEVARMIKRNGYHRTG